MIERNAARFNAGDWFLTEVDKDGPTCKVTGILDGVPVSFFGDVEEGLIIGGAVEWNQILENGNFDSLHDWQKSSNLVNSMEVSDNVLTAVINGGETEPGWKYGVFCNSGDIPAGASDHYFFCTWDVNPSTDTTVRFELGGSMRKESDVIPANTWKTISFINKKGANNQQVYAYPYSAVNQVVAPAMTMKYRNVMVIDLTAMFGSDMADALYAMEQAEAGSGIAIFKTLFPADYYEYDAGTEKTLTLR